MIVNWMGWDGRKEEGADVVVVLFLLLFYTKRKELELDEEWKCGFYFGVICKHWVG